MSTSRSQIFGIGLQTAGLAAGGQTTPSGLHNTVEEYGGTSWTSGGALNTAKIW